MADWLVDACSDRTIRRRLDEWAQPGIAQKVHAALHAYDLIIGLELGDVSVDGCITKAPCGDKAGPSPVDRRKGGLKRSTALRTHSIRYSPPKMATGPDR